MIRAARAGDKADVMAIYNVCFPGEESFCRWFFDRVYRPENTLVWEQDGLAAAVQLLPVRLALGGRQVPCTYIYAAGTLPQLRGRGLMAALLERSFALSAARGDQLSVLITQEPSLIGYYARFGYRPVFARSLCTAQKGTLPADCVIRPMEPRDTGAVQGLYRAAQGSLYGVRGAEDWRLIAEQYGENARVLERMGRGVTAFALLEGGQDSLNATEALGPEAGLLMAALAGRHPSGTARWFAPAQRGGEPNGCVRPLTAFGERLLADMPGPGYLNVLFN